MMVIGDRASDGGCFSFCAAFLVYRVFCYLVNSFLGGKTSRVGHKWKFMARFVYNISR